MSDQIIGMWAWGNTTSSSQRKTEEEPAAKASTAAPKPARGPERRNNLRARISMPLRVRTANFSDGSLEQVSATQNTSRKGFYFVTSSDRYYKGMRLRIAFPYHGTDDVGDVEQMGEVVRVDKKSNAYGVAVTLSTNPETSYAVIHESREEQHKAAVGVERRASKRFAFVAGAEIIEMRNENITQAHTSDLSLSGCYIDTLNPLPVGATFDLWIQKANERLEATAKVCTQHPGSGMGVTFKDLTPDQLTVVKSWLFEASTGAN